MVRMIIGGCLLLVYVPALIGSIIARDVVGIWLLICLSGLSLLLFRWGYVSRRKANERREVKGNDNQSTTNTT